MKWKFLMSAFVVKGMTKRMGVGFSACKAKEALKLVKQQMK